MSIDESVRRGPHDLGSYSIKLIHPNITNELKKRATSGNSVETIMPFIRLSSAIELGSNVSVKTQNRLVTPGKYFSIGLHSTQTHGPTDIFLEQGKLSNYNNPFESVYNIFNSTNADLGPVIGTIRQEVNGNVLSQYVRAKTDASSPEQNFALATDNLYAAPPGITSAKIDRKNNGQINSAQIEITIPTLAQFEALAEIFFVPGVTMILEWGRLSSSVKEDLIMLPWHNLQDLEKVLAKNNWYGPTALEIFNDYTYPSKGRYSFIVGKLASFEATMNNSGEFVLSIKLIGPGEQNFAYSIYETVSAIIAEEDGAQNVGAGSIETYFAENGDYATLLTNPTEIAGTQWENHIIKPAANAGTGNPESNKSATESPDGQAATREEQKNNPAFLAEMEENDDAIFISWKFFVNVVLNDENIGIKKYFKDAGMSLTEVENIRILNPLVPPAGGGREDGIYRPSRFVPERFPADNTRVVSVPGPAPRFAPIIADEDPDEPHVGCHTYLRSTNPAVCIIYNEAAESSIRNGNSPWKATLTDAHLSRIADSNLEKFKLLGSFAQGDDHDKGLLSRGVWLNANAIKQSLLSGKTLHEGIANLLNRMNASVTGYWELTLDYDEQEVKFNSQSTTPKGINNFLVVDRKYRGTLDRLRNGKIYKFNKYFNPSSGVGSELVDFTVGLNTPPLLMTQLAFSRPATAESARGVLVGGYDSSMQTLFEPVVSGGLSLMDIDIVRKRIRAEQTTSNLRGSGVYASGQPGANSSTQGAVIRGQSTATIEATALPTLQEAAERESVANVERMKADTEKQIEELQKKKTELLASINNPRGDATGGQSASQKQQELDRLNQTIAALTNNKNAFDNATGPIKKFITASNRFPHLRSVFTMIEFAPHIMSRMILREPALDNDAKNNYTVNNNLKYSLNPLEANLVLPGISGIRVGELVRLGRLPKRLFENRGAWQILGITDDISSESGWITNMRCRFMPLPPIIVNNLQDI
jgi:hypothetical protein